LTAVIRAALAAVDPGRLVRAACGRADVADALAAAAAVDVIAAGKAAGAMLSAFADASTRTPRHVIGAGTGPSPALPQGARWHATTHPVPDQRSVVAARDALDTARAAGEGDLLVLLLSGGASSMMALPADQVTLGDKQQTSQRLLSLGAEIHDLNAVRKHLSAIKGGQLAAANAGRTLTLALSDVVGDQLSAIGSGPAVADDTAFGDALAVLDRYGGITQYPAPVVQRLQRGAAGHVPETPKPGDPRLARSAATVIGGGRTAVAGAAGEAAARGYAVYTIDHPITGEARLAAPELLELAMRAVQPSSRSRPACIVAGGETTVRTSGTGKGGRNQELALALTEHLHRLGSTVVAASIGTDGIDGPTDAAGAVVDTTTVQRAAAAHVAAIDRYLNEHNSYLFFDQLGDLIRTGPTGTNVGDLQVILVGG
jgi:hydroxypyruvate reductase